MLELLVRERVLQMTTLRSFAEAGTADPSEGSIRKLAHAVLLEVVTSAGVGTMVLPDAFPLYDDEVGAS